MGMEDGLVILTAGTIAIVAICFSLVGYFFIKERRARRSGRIRR